MKIRTRVWDNTLKKFHYYGGVFGHKKPFKECSNFIQYESCPEYNQLEEPQLWTGLPDSNGVLIYEGDIVERTKFVYVNKDGTPMENENEPEEGEIMWDSFNCCFIVGYEEGADLNNYSDALRSIEHTNSYLIEIIGHVHEPCSLEDTDVICED